MTIEDKYAKLIQKYQTLSVKAAAKSYSDYNTVRLLICRITNVNGKIGQIERTITKLNNELDKLAKELKLE